MRSCRVPAKETEVALDFYSEFNGIVRALQGARIRYAVMGGVAVAIHGGVRSTKDIDFLVHPGDVDRFRSLLKSLGFLAKSDSITFRKSGLTLHRFLKFERGETHFYMVDVLVADTVKNRRMLSRADRRVWGGGHVRVLKRADLIELKKARSSHTDLSDIDTLRGLDAKEDDEG